MTQEPGKTKKAILLVAGAVMLAFDEFARSLQEAIRIVEQGPGEASQKLGRRAGKPQSQNVNQEK